MEIKANADNYEYIQYVTPMCLEKALATLHGFLEGILVDGVIDPEEVENLKAWMQEYSEYSGKHPFNEILEAMEMVVQQENPDIESVRDILWLCTKLLEKDGYFSMTTTEMQRLQGILAGILADGVITKDELKGLQEWIWEHETLKGCWPFDEVEAVIAAVLKDGVVDENERKMLKKYFSEFVGDASHKSISLKEDELSLPIKGVCAMCPKIEFKGKTFCFTGKFQKIPRKQLASMTEGMGGVFTNSLTKKVDYLVIGSDGNVAWAFSCYGRKVEQAIEYRKQGRKIVIVHEFDYWDAVQDNLVE